MGVDADGNEIQQEEYTDKDGIKKTKNKNLVSKSYNITNQYITKQKRDNH